MQVLRLTAEATKSAQKQNYNMYNYLQFLVWKLCCCCCCLFVCLVVFVFVLVLVLLVFLFYCCCYCYCFCYCFFFFFFRSSWCSCLFVIFVCLFVLICFVLIVCLFVLAIGKVFFVFVWHFLPFARTTIEFCASFARGADEKILGRKTVFIGSKSTLSLFALQVPLYVQLVVLRVCWSNRTSALH